MQWFFMSNFTTYIRIRAAVAFTCSFMLFLPTILFAQNTSSSDLIQMNTFQTGIKNQRMRTVPSTDPSGITYHAPTGHLFIVDSEIDEVEDIWQRVQANVFEISLDGTVVFESYNLVDELTTGLKNDEPEGIAYSEFDGFFYIVDDDVRRLSRYERLPKGDRHILYARDWININLLPETADMKGDLEGVTVDPVTGLIYVVDGNDAEIAIFRYTTAFEFVGRISVLDNDGRRYKDPEGLAIHPGNGNLFIASSRRNSIMEMTKEGQFLRYYQADDLHPSQIAMEGLTFGPSSYSAVNQRGQINLYIADGRSDISVDATEFDGIVYEAFATIDPEEARKQRTEIAHKFTLMQNFPNPFNTSTTITFNLLEDAHVTIRLYSIRGEEIATIVDAFHPAGVHSAPFDATGLAGGVYYYKMRVRNSYQSRRLLFLK